jgi:hypothetical protein
MFLSSFVEKKNNFNWYTIWFKNISQSKKTYNNCYYSILRISIISEICVFQYFLQLGFKFCELW